MRFQVDLFTMNIGSRSDWLADGVGVLGVGFEKFYLGRRQSRSLSGHVTRMWEEASALLPSRTDLTGPSTTLG